MFSSGGQPFADVTAVVQVAMHFLNFEARHLFGSLSQLQLGIVDRFFDLVRHLYQDLSSKKTSCPICQVSHHIAP